MDLTSYRTLGRSGLVVSPMALGTMTFGTDRWGASDEAARSIFDRYVERGGNFIDTAEVYSGGRSEEMLGGYIAEGALRDRLGSAPSSPGIRTLATPTPGAMAARPGPATARPPV